MRKYSYFIRVEVKQDGTILADGKCPGNMVLYRTRLPKTKVKADKTDHKEFLFEFLSNHRWYPSDNMRHYHYRQHLKPTTENEFILEHL